jgi:hypothetical protein
MTDEDSVSTILWSMARLIVAVLIVSPILIIAGLADLVGIGCNRAFHFITRIMRVDLEDT